MDEGFHLAILLLVLIGAFILSLGEESYLFFAIALVACGAHGLWMKEWGGMSVRAANAVVFTLAVLCGIERLVFGHYVVICTAHFLAAAQMIILWSSPTHRNIMWLILITVAHAAVGTVRTVELGYGVSIILLTLCGSWALVLFLFRREALAASPHEEPRMGGMLAPSLRLGALILLIALALFFVFPRFQANMFRQNVIAPTRPISGFSERVTFGDLGRIITSSEKVMDVKLTKDGQPTQAGDIPLYWRGTSLDTYDAQGGRWSWMCTSRGQIPVGVGNISKVHRGFARGGGELRQSINLEPLNTRLLFCLYPIRSLRILGWGPEVWVVFGPTAGMMSTRSNRTQILKYEVTSDVLPTREKPVLAAPDRLRGADLRTYRSLPPGLDPRIGQLARRVAAPERFLRPQAKRIEGYLRDSGTYTYSLNLDTPPEVEPISDFLFRRRAGHCEYFASAMVVMLRTLGIPARMVNGFKGGDWNEFGSFYVVRQSHAHSWVEAYFEDTGWTTFDPTPMVAESPALAVRVVGMAARLVDYFDVTWVNLFIAYSQENQAELLGTNLDRVVKSGLFARLEGFADRVLSPVAGILSRGHSRSEDEDAPEAGLLLRVGRALAVLVLTILTMAGIVWVGKAMWSRMGRRTRLDVPGRLYDRFCAIMAGRGFRRGEGQTPREFAGRIAAAAPEWAEDVREITEGFCRARYGGHELAPATWISLNERVNRLARWDRQRAAHGQHGA